MYSYTCKHGSVSVCSSCGLVSGRRVLQRPLNFKPLFMEPVIENLNIIGALRTSPQNEPSEACARNDKSPINPKPENPEALNARLLKL